MDGKPMASDPAQLGTWFSEATEKLNAFQTRLSEQCVEIEAQQEQLTAREAALAQRETELEQLRLSIASQQDELRQRDATLRQLKGEVDQREIMLRAQQEQLEDSERRLSETLQQFRATTTKMERREIELCEKSEALQRCEDAITRFQGTFEELFRQNLMRSASATAALAARRPMKPYAELDLDDAGSAEPVVRYAPSDRPRLEPAFTPRADRTPAPRAPQPAQPGADWPELDALSAAGASSDSVDFDTLLEGIGVASSGDAAR